MAKFYGTLDGARGRATRCGSASSGMTATAASWEGAARAEVYQDMEGRVCARLSVVSWQGVGPDRVIYDGPMSEVMGWAGPQ